MPPGVVGDLEAGTTFESTLAARHHVSSAGREVLLFVLDVKHVSWAHNLLLNLDELGIGGRALGIAQTSAACTALFERVSPDTASCGHSSFLRKSSNATVARYLKTWRIRHDHVYHLWWQRWHYLGWAVRLGYNALSLDSDISVRADPYALFHGALAHRNLIVGLDSDASGSERPGAFPMINVGLVYCQRCQAGGPAHRVLTDVIRRVFAFFEGPLLWKTKSKHTMIAERVLWEQTSSRRPRACCLRPAALGVSPRAWQRQPARGWPRLCERRGGTAAQLALRATVTCACPRAAAVPVAPLGRAVKLPACVGRRRVAQALSAPARRGGGERCRATLVALLPVERPTPWCGVRRPVGVSAAPGDDWPPGWLHFEAPYDAPAWLVALRGLRGRHGVGRQGGRGLVGSRRGRRPPPPPLPPPPPSPPAAAAHSAPPPRPATASPMMRGDGGDGARVFRDDARLLVLRWHSLHIGAPNDVGGAWDAIRRFSMLALSLGRRAVLPLVPCALSPCAPRVPTPLRPFLATITIGDAAACAEEPLTSRRLTAEALAPRASRAPLGWAPSPNTSLWWWEPRRRQQRAERAGCCQPIPLFGPCIDPAGARRPLGHEPLLATADLAQFLAEASTSAARHAPAEVATAHLPANWTDAAFNDLRDPMASHRVLVLDAAGEPLRRLPSIAWLKASGGAGAAEAIGPHAARCFDALTRAEVQAPRR